MTFLVTSSPPTPATEATLDNDPWFPAIHLVDLRAACRLDGTVTPARLRESALAAVASINRELRAYQAQHAGLATLADVPARQIGGVSEPVLHYRRAVYSAVQADLVEAYREFDSTGKGDKNADALEPRADTHRRNLRWALNDLQGLPRTTVDLI